MSALRLVVESVLACGGFPHDIARRKALFPHAPSGTEHYSPGPTGNTGDGLRLGESVGGRVDTSLPNAAAWVPVSITTRKDGSKGVMPHFIDRAKPGVIAVTADGKRFTNEGSSYHDFVQAMTAACAGRDVSAYLICDHQTLRKYGLGAVAPFPLPISKHLRSGYLVKGSSVRDLAGKIGVDPTQLEATVRRSTYMLAKGKILFSAKVRRHTTGTKVMRSMRQILVLNRWRKHPITPSSW